MPRGSLQFLIVVFPDHTHLLFQIIRHIMCVSYDSSPIAISWFIYIHKGALAWYGKLTWESAHAWILKILCYLIVWGITLIYMVRLSFDAIQLLIYDVMNDTTIIP